MPPGGRGRSPERRWSQAVSPEGPCPAAPPLWDRELYPDPPVGAARTLWEGAGAAMWPQVWSCPRAGRCPGMDARPPIWSLLWGRVEGNAYTDSKVKTSSSALPEQRREQRGGCTEAAAGVEALPREQSRQAPLPMLHYKSGLSLPLQCSHGPRCGRERPPGLLLPAALPCPVQESTGLPCTPATRPRESVENTGWP